MRVTLLLMLVVRRTPQEWQWHTDNAYRPLSDTLIDAYRPQSDTLIMPTEHRVTHWYICLQTTELKSWLHVVQHLWLDTLTRSIRVCNIFYTARQTYSSFSCPSPLCLFVSLTLSNVILVLMASSMTTSSTHPTGWNWNAVIRLKGRTRRQEHNKCRVSDSWNTR